MGSVVKNEFQSREYFKFHGRAGEYFIICLTNLLLCVISVGILTPWAIVRSRRYVYESMELYGARFGYHATGLALFLSWLLCGVFFIVVSLLYTTPVLQGVLLAVFFLVLPVLMVNSIKYNAIMTTLNNIRFNFHCSSGRALWVMSGLPVLLYILLAVVILVVMNIPGGDQDSIVTSVRKVVLAVVIFLIGAGIIAGMVYVKWMVLLGEGGQFGTRRFSVTPDVKQCIKICLLSMLIPVPFLGVIVWLFSGIFSAMMGMEGMVWEMQDAIILNYQGQIIACYLLYFVAMLLSTGYMWVGLRNHFMNNLTMANGSVRFHSDIVFHSLMIQWISIGLASAVTLGLAYPLMKMRYLRYLAANTWFDGALDMQELTDHNEQPETGPVAILSRGLMLQIPFI